MTKSAAILLVSASLLLTALATPLVDFPRGNFTCIVEVTPHETPKKNLAQADLRFPPVLKRILITKFNGLRRDVSEWSDGSVSELWTLAGEKTSVWESNAASKDIFVLRGGLQDRMRPPLLEFDNSSVAWIREKNLVNRTGDAIEYKANQAIPMGAEKSAPSSSATYQAWIDPVTLLPLRFDDGAALYVLKFGPPPEEPLRLPENMKAELDRWRTALRPRPPL